MSPWVPSFDSVWTVHAHICLHPTSLLPACNVREEICNSVLLRIGCLKLLSLHILPVLSGSKSLEVLKQCGEPIIQPFPSVPPMGCTGGCSGTSNSSESSSMAGQAQMYLITATHHAQVRLLSRRYAEWQHICCMDRTISRHYTHFASSPLQFARY